MIDLSEIINKEFTDLYRENISKKADELYNESGTSSGSVNLKLCRCALDLLLLDCIENINDIRHTLMLTSTNFDTQNEDYDYLSALIS